jgi:hypothetical protein
MSILSPPICLKCKATTVSRIGSTNRYTTTLTTVGGQAYSNGTAYYNCRSIAVGMWYSNAAEGFAWQVTTINSSPAPTGSSVSVVLTDVNSYNALIDPAGNGTAPNVNKDGYIFQLNSLGIPVLPQADSPFNSVWNVSQLGRFFSLMNTTIGSSTTSGLTGSISLGSGAGATGQGQNATAVGSGAGATGQGENATAVGTGAGASGQGQNATAVGTGAGATGQGQNATAVGTGAGGTRQGQNATAVGFLAGATAQGINTVAIGNAAGASGQGGMTGYSVAIGYLSGNVNQGAYSIGIGAYAGQTGQPNNSIVLNAAGPTAINGATANALYIAPIRTDLGTTGKPLYYSITNEIVVGPAITVPSFIFDGGNSTSNYSVGPAFDCGNSA